MYLYDCKYNNRENPPSPLLFQNLAYFQLTAATGMNMLPCGSRSATAWNGSEGTTGNPALASAGDAYSVSRYGVNTTCLAFQFAWG